MVELNPQLFNVITCFMRFQLFLYRSFKDLSLYQQPTPIIINLSSRFSLAYIVKILRSSHGMDTVVKLRTMCMVN